MLDIEKLKGNEQLNGLTDEQLSVIAEMSKNDEDAQFGSRFAEIHNELDELTKSVSGKGKNTNEKTADYIRRTLTEMKDGLKEVETLRSEKKALEQKIAEGLNPDEELKKQLATKDATIADVRKQYNALKSEYESAKESHKNDLLNMRIDQAIMSAMGGIKLKDDVNEAMMKMAKESAVQKVKASRPTFVDNGEGGERLIFHTEDGAEMRDPEQNLGLTTVDALLKKQFKQLGLLDDGIPSAGGTGGKGGSGKGSGGTINLGACHSKDEAMAVIEQSLRDRGMRVGSMDYQNEMAKIWKDNQGVISQLK